MDTVRSAHLGDSVKHGKLRRDDIRNAARCLGVFSAIAGGFIDESFAEFRKIYSKYNPEYKNLDKVISES